MTAAGVHVEPRASPPGFRLVYPDADAADVTVVTPTIAGREKMLAAALASVDRQTRRPKAVEVVFDEHRRGAFWARNEGASLVETRWICWLDDDDELGEEHVEILVAVAEETGAGLVYSYAAFVGPDGEPRRDPLAVVDDAGHLIAAPIRVPFGAKQAAWLRQVGNYLPVCYLVETAAVVKVGGFPEPWSAAWPRCCEDHGLLVRLLDAGVRFVNACAELPEQPPTWIYHYHGENTGGLGVRG